MDGAFLCALTLMGALFPNTLAASATTVSATLSPDITVKVDGTAENGSFIGAERAKSIALTHAGLTSSQVTFVKAELDHDDGRWVYEVEFYTNGDQEYDYEIEIDAYSGAGKRPALQQTRPKNRREAADNSS